MNIDQIRARPTQFLSLTSLTVAEFDDLLPIFESLWQDWIGRFTWSGKPRRRKYVPKDSNGLTSASSRLFFILTYQKNATLQQYHAASFGLTQDMANKWIHVLTPLLEKATARWRPAQGAYQLSPEQEVALDATERTIDRPYYEQQDSYSGKKKAHTCKNLLLIALTGYVLFVSPTVEGKVHDKHLADRYFCQVERPSRVRADLGFVGFQPKEATLILPHKKPKGGSLTAIQKAENRQQARRRVFVEHAIGQLKTLRIVKDKNRNKKFGYRDTIMRIAVQLHNFRCYKRRTFFL